MKIVHISLDAGTASSLPALRRDLESGDVFVVAPGKDFRRRFAGLLDQQLVARIDAHDALAVLAGELKEMAPSPEFQKEADAAVERIYTVLCQGMSLSFRDSSLTDYLHAMLVRLCGRCFASMIGAESFVDGREVILCESNNGLPLIDWALTEKQVKALLSGPGTKVVAGFYGRKVTGETLPLGQGGSELTASILAALLNADKVRYCVGGLRVRGSARLTYDEAAQRFSSGDPVFPPALLPARKAGIPSELVDLSGACALTISTAAEGSVEQGITGVVRSGAMNLLTVYGSALLGSVGISSALFGILAREGVNIHFISQSLAEYSISFAVKREDDAKAVRALKALLADTSRSNYTDLSYTDVPVEILSVFGQGMRHVPGISARVYSALGAAGVNVIAASQGGEELSISVVVDETQATCAEEALEKL